MVQAIFWKQDTHSVNHKSVGSLFKSAVLKVPEFTLGIFDLPNTKTHDQWNQQLYLLIFYPIAWVDQGNHCVM